MVGTDRGTGALGGGHRRSGIRRGWRDLGYRSLRRHEQRGVRRSRQRVDPRRPAHRHGGWPAGRPRDRPLLLAHPNGRRSRVPGGGQRYGRGAAAAPRGGAGRVVLRDQRTRVRLDRPARHVRRDPGAGSGQRRRARRHQGQLGGAWAAYPGRRADIGKAEGLSMPILLVLLIFVFGSVVAATTPLMVGGLAILGAFVATRLLTQVTEVSIFAINIITLVGLGLSIDYALFVVSRYREELDKGHAVPEAIERTLATAGRTVAVSGLTVALAMASLLLFPQVFLRSMGFGGMAAVLVAMLASLTVLPALLAILGRRAFAWRVRVPGRQRATAPGATWARIAHAVMRRPVLVVLGTVAVLGVLASPFVRAEFGGIDERVLPPGTESRVVSEQIKANFPGGGVDHIKVLVSGADQATTASLAADIGRLPHVTGAQVAGNKDRSWLIAVSYEGESGGPVARCVVADIRALPKPAGAEVLVGGRAAELTDLLASLSRRLPGMALLVAGMTFVLLFLAFGSVLLPIKAVVMNVVSIGASFGAVVWAFQDGHLASLLGFTSTGFLESTQVVLMLAILFGLSTDYEVFLLSRVREEWDRTGDNTASVAGGLQRTGRIITSAALLLVVVIGGFATGGIVFIKMIGV